MKTERPVQFHEQERRHIGWEWKASIVTLAVILLIICGTIFLTAISALTDENRKINALEFILFLFLTLITTGLAIFAIVATFQQSPKLLLFTIIAAAILTPVIIIGTIVLIITTDDGERSENSTSIIVPIIMTTLLYVAFFGVWIVLMFFYRQRIIERDNLVKNNPVPI